MTGLTIDRESDVPLYRQIVEGLREAVGRGALSAPDRLPPSRSLASELGVNRLTVARAYAELGRAGIVSARVGRGTFVASPPAGRKGADRSGAHRSPAVVSWAPLFSRSSSRATEAGSAGGAASGPLAGSVSFASLFPDPSLFPTETFRRALCHVLRRDGPRVLGYGPPAGHPDLREMIATGLRGRGVPAVAEEIVVTSGSQQGIDLVARALVDPGDVVLVENPTYTGAVQVFHASGATLVGVPVDEQGAIVSTMQRAVERHRPKLVYLMPNFQNPTSETMSLERRREVVELASRARLPVLEDDFGGDLRFEGPALPALKALDRDGVIVYLSTFAKKLLPGLRIGWVAAPRELAARLAALKTVTDHGTSPLLQAALYEFCRGGGLERHLEHVVACYRERRDAMLSAMKRSFPPQVAWTRPRGGLAVWVTLPDGVDADEVAAEAESRGVLVGRGDLFYVDGGTRHNLRLAFSQAPPADIQRGVRMLGDLIKRKIKARRTAPATGSPEPLPLI